MLSRGHDLLNLVLWLAGGVVLHDGVLALVVLAVGAVAVRLLPQAAKAPAVVGFVVLGSVTLLAVPVLGQVRRPVRQPVAAGPQLHGRVAGARRRWSWSAWSRPRS